MASSGSLTVLAYAPLVLAGNTEGITELCPWSRCTVIIGSLHLHKAVITPQNGGIPTADIR